MGNANSTAPNAAATPSSPTDDVSPMEALPSVRLRSDAFAGLLAHAATVKNSKASRATVFVAAGEDFTIERDVLATHLMPFVMRFCTVLGVDLEAIDMNWNLTNEAIHENRDTERHMARLEQSFNDNSSITIFISLLGDKYGPSALPTTIPESEFTAIRETLLSSPDSHSVPALLDTWYIRDENTLPTPVYRLQPVSSVFTSSAQSEAGRKEAGEMWAGIRGQLGELIQAGAAGAGIENPVYGKSLVDLEVSMAAGGKRKEGVFCFQ
ncbi:hypothetical protein HDU98_011957 [Podochytrium sp. JEL0797]|nr:hypothetical protein HDU98_011957 [Podochytrium sp. JEL0797]